MVSCRGVVFIYGRCFLARRWSEIPGRNRGDCSSFEILWFRSGCRSKKRLKHESAPQCANWPFPSYSRAFQYHCQKSPPEKHGFHLRKSKKNRKSTQMHFLVLDLVGTSMFTIINSTYFVLSSKKVKNFSCTSPRKCDLW